MDSKKTAVILGLNIFSLFYFLLLVYLSYFPIKERVLEIFMGVIRELITILLILFVIFSVGYSIYRFIKRDRGWKVIGIFACSILSILVMVVATITEL